MKNITRFLTLLAVVFGVQFADAQIVSDGLNNSSSLFTITGSGVYRNSSSGASDAPASSPYFSEGTYGLTLTNGTTTLTSSNINTTGYTGINLSFKLASFSINGS